MEKKTVRVLSHSLEWVKNFENYIPLISSFKADIVWLCDVEDVAVNDGIKPWTVAWNFKKSLEESKKMSYRCHEFPQFSTRWIIDVEAYNWSLLYTTMKENASEKLHLQGVYNVWSDWRPLILWEKPWTFESSYTKYWLKWIKAKLSQIANFHKKEWARGAEILTFWEDEIFENIALATLESHTSHEERKEQLKKILERKDGFNRWLLFWNFNDDEEFRSLSWYLLEHCELYDVYWIEEKDTKQRKNGIFIPWFEKDKYKIEARVYPIDKIQGESEISKSFMSKNPILVADITEKESNIWQN